MIDTRKFGRWASQNHERARKILENSNDFQQFRGELTMSRLKMVIQGRIQVAPYVACSTSKIPDFQKLFEKSRWQIYKLANGRKIGDMFRCRGNFRWGAIDHN